MREADVGDPPAPAGATDLIQRRLVPVHMHIYGHVDTCRIRPAVSLEDVDNHRIVSYGVPSRPIS